ncbi:MAG: 3D domain-containing protein [Candidatus Latescibacteria bacterium]|nr:3D domain-containing protein [Candidatus Latescibacterota bacterium]
MRKRTAWSSLIWRLRTGAFGFYVEGGRRLAGTVRNSARPARRRRPTGVAAVGTGLVLVLLPMALLVTDGSRSIRLAGELVDGRPAEEVASLRGPLERYYKNREEGRSAREVAVTVSVSAYTSRECETDDTPFITAANTSTRPGVLALSRDLLKRYTPGAPFDFGDIVHIKGLGDFVVEDSMNGRWRNRADIWFESVDDARAFGRRGAVLTGPYGLASGQKLKRSIDVASAKPGASK